MKDVGEVRNTYKILFGMPEGKRPVGRKRRRWKDNIKVYFRKILGRVRIGLM
jgi:hypothetical protein